MIFEKDKKNILLHTLCQIQARKHYTYTFTMGDICIHVKVLMIPMIVQYLHRIVRLLYCMYTRIPFDRKHNIIRQHPVLSSNLCQVFLLQNVQSINDPQYNLVNYNSGPFIS